MLPPSWQRPIIMSAGCWVGAPTRYSRKSPLGDKGLVERKAGQYGASPSTPGRVQRGRLLLSSPGEEGEEAGGEREQEEEELQCGRRRLLAIFPDISFRR